MDGLRMLQVDTYNTSNSNNDGVGVIGYKAGKNKKKQTMTLLFVRRTEWVMNQQHTHVQMCIRPTRSSQMLK